VQNTSLKQGLHHDHDHHHHHIYFLKTQNTNNHSHINTVHSEGCQRSMKLADWSPV